MESGWRNSFHGCSSNFTNTSINAAAAWDHIWDDHHNLTTNTTTTTTSYHNHDWSTTATVPDQAGVVHGFLLGVHHRPTTDPHTMCLKLGKRHYYEDTAVVVPDHPPHHLPPAESSPTTTTTKRGKPPHPYYLTTTDTTTTATTTVWPVGERVRSSSSQVVPRCQVEGCHVALGNVKEYYRRHKVCEIHSKAPKVVVLGLQQRFCQQCSRFHGVTEFDEAKRSCRRRLKGHNQRRRKGTLLQRSFPHSHLAKTAMIEPRLPPPSPSSSSSQTKLGCALSLLSSPQTEPWSSSGDLASRCSAALYELIAANRATSVFGHLFNQNTHHHHHDSVSGNTTNMSAENEMWDRSNTSTTHDLQQQAPAMEFGLLSMKGKSKEPEEWTDYCWSSFGGANVV